mmetsp:Transcript_22259/g.37211  ORF Transcript_22259/g.37211 Transcript_22259/m.37211 type:complete len:227 (+) Transcript_22259:167-847(+)
MPSPIAFKPGTIFSMPGSSAAIASSALASNWHVAPSLFIRLVVRTRSVMQFSRIVSSIPSNILGRLTGSSDTVPPCANSLPFSKLITSSYTGTTDQPNALIAMSLITQRSSATRVNCGSLYTMRTRRSGSERYSSAANMGTPVAGSRGSRKGNTSVLTASNTNNRSFLSSNFTQSSFPFSPGSATSGSISPPLSSTSSISISGTSAQLCSSPSAFPPGASAQLWSS